MNSTRQNRHVYASTSNDHSISDGETELETFQGNNHIANRRDQAAEYYVEQLLLHFKRKAGQRRYGQAKKFEETTKVTCPWATFEKRPRKKFRSTQPATFVFFAQTVGQATLSVNSLVVTLKSCPKLAFRSLLFVDLCAS